MDKNKSSAIGYLQKGKTNQKLGNLKEALGDYNAAISINESTPEFYIARGSLRLVMKQKKNSLQRFQDS